MIDVRIPAAPAQVPVLRRWGVRALGSVPRTWRMGLATRLALLTAAMAVALVLGATEIALSWSQRSRLDDLQLESVALANTLATFLMRIAPTGNTEALGQGLAGWSRHRITETRADVFVGHPDTLALGASSDSATPGTPDEVDRRALRQNHVQIRLRPDPDPAWQVAMPLGATRPYGVLDVRVSTRRLQDWARQERARAYMFALVSALLLAAGVALLTAHWVGRPLRELGRAMAGAHAGAEGAPPARETGAAEFRALAREYNRMRDALTARERESAARAGLLSLEERARGLDRITLIEETAAGLAHEIGTPLNTVRGHLQLLRDDLQAAREGIGVSRVDLLLSQVDRVAHIVRSGLERGRWPAARPHPTNLGDTAARMLRFLEPSLQEAGVHAAVSVAPGPVPLAYCDPAMVEQILLNLLKNAVEALPAGGHVEVRAGRTGRLTFVDVTDDGPGVGAEAQGQLFRAFASTKGAGGHGLGLVVSRRLARALHGDLVYIVQASGARWRLTLPAPEEEVPS